MRKVRVAINGYGTIGRRVADAVMKQDDMILAGVTKASPDFRCDEAREKGIDVYAVSGVQQFEEKGYRVEGELRDLLEKADVVIDCSPKRKGEKNRKTYGEFPRLKAIFQGGEPNGIAEISFNSHSNYDAAKGKKSARVVSCNTTALCRVASQLRKSFGLRKARVAIVRRSVDPGASNTKGPVNAWEPTIGYPSHHAADVKAILPDIRITSLAGIAPMTIMHGHMLFAELEKAPKSSEEVAEALAENSRIKVISSGNGYRSTAQIKDYAEANGSKGNVYEACVWKESIGIDEDGEVGMHIAIDQQADVVPENIDAIRAMFCLMEAEESIAKTDKSLGIGKQRHEIRMEVPADIAET